MSVAVINLQRARKIDTRRLKGITTVLLLELEVEKPELGVCLVNTAEMTRLNETFLRHSGPTDVITFDYRSGDTSAGGRVSPRPTHRGPGLPALHGEIFICVDEAILQARKYGTRWESELIRYLVHGTLHLLGFDDARAGARREMKREEDRLLRGLSRRFSLAKLSRPANISA